ncbi:MAG: hypothetical protein NC218_02570 [Acetobacter sp.]|nr:hypothetical protein [Acetobacter sp.]
MFRPCIGIISYFPDKEELRNERVYRCRFFFDQLREYFPDVPIIVIAQNWRNEIDISDNMMVYSYDKPLTILGARRTLTQKFLFSDYTHIITFDDDCVLRGGRESAIKFLAFVGRNQDRYINQRNLFKLSVFPRRIFEKYPLPDMQTEKGEGMEDLAYFEILRQHERGILDISETGLSETSEWRYDSYSTYERPSASKLLKNTASYIKKQQKGVKK